MDPAGRRATFEVMRADDLLTFYFAANRIGTFSTGRVAALLKGRPGDFVRDGDLALQRDYGGDAQIFLATSLGSWSCVGPWVGVPE
jgi:hypothetical protein